MSPPASHPELIRLSDRAEEALEAAAAALRAGGVVLVPTDTVYGLAALTPGAVEDLFVLKDRPAERIVAVLVADRAAVESLAAEVPPALAELMDVHWPGPLTVVLPRKPTPGPPIGGDGETVGVRCPDHQWMRRLLADVGPLAVTSANRHGLPTPALAADVLAMFDKPPAAGSDSGHSIAEADSGRSAYADAGSGDSGDADDSTARIADTDADDSTARIADTDVAGSTARIAVAVDGGPCAAAASTVVAWRDGAVEVLRPGPLNP